jgi:hypothetical protein
MEKEKIKLYDPKQDPEFQKPYVDIDEWRDGSVRYHYIHGGFEDTKLKFSLYFPDKEDYKGRFYHFMSPVQGSEDASQIRIGEEDKITFAINNGAYFVESNMGGPEANGTTIYRASAAVAEYSREIAAKIYGSNRPFGYIYGGSGGGFKTMSCFENTNVWDGAVPYVIGSPVAIPNNFTVFLHATRILRNKLPMIADSMEPGGNGDIYAGLDLEERAALEEVTKMGFPTRAWFTHEFSDLGAFPLFIPVIEQIDPSYFEDFWTVPGYLGAEPNSSAVRDRLQHKTVITETNLVFNNMKAREENTTGVDDAWQRFKSIDLNVFQPWMRLESVPAEDVYLTGTNIVFLTGDAAGEKVPLEKLEGDKAFVAEGFGLQGLVEILEKVKPGDEIILDNSNFIALQTYHRHQVPSIDFKVWDQYRDEDGKPLYPQRPVLIGPMMAEGGAGSIQSGCFEGKMIVVASLLDSAFPWQPDWYRTKIKEHLGNEEYKHFRLWYMDNAIHNDEAKTADDLHCISYLGALHQALLDLSAWVERGIEPADSTQYSVSDGQIIIPLKANERKGIQPVVTLKANGSQCVEVSVGDNVHFLAEVEVPHNTGKLTAAEWSFEGDINYPIKGNFTNINDDYTIATVEADYVFSKPGTYFPVVRVKSNREGDLNNIFTQVKNLCRVRVIVR